MNFTLILSFYLRKLIRSKFSYFFIFSGLSLGVAILILVYAFYSFEYTYGASTPDSDKIFRIQTITADNTELALASGHLATLFKNEIPFINESTRAIKSQTETVFRHKERFIPVPIGSGFYVDQDFPQFFEFEIQKGNIQQFSSNESSVIITETLSKKLFEEENPIGKQIDYLVQNDGSPIVVTAVVADPAKQSHFQFEYLLRGEVALGDFWEQSTRLKYPMYYVYFKTANDIENTEFISSTLNNIIGENETKDFKLSLILLKDIHFHSKANFEHAELGNLMQVQIIGIGGLLLFFAAFSNFIILLLSQMIERKQEFDIRKQLGLSAFDLQLQIGFEIFLTCFIVAILGFFVSYLIDIYFLIDLLDMRLIETLSLEGLLVGLTVFGLTLLMTYLVVYGYLSKILGNSILSKTQSLHYHVVIFIQGFFTLIVVLATFYVWQQMSFLASKNIGYEDHSRISLQRPMAAPSSNWKAFKNALKNESGIRLAGTSLYKWVGSDYNTRMMSFFSLNTDSVKIRVQYNAVDPEFIETVGAKLIEGRDFNPGITSDSFNIIINESLAKMIEGNPIGKKFNSKMLGDKSGEIIGIINDYHFSSFENKIPPTVLFRHDERYLKENVIIHFATQNENHQISKIEKLWNNAGILSPFEFQYLENMTAKLIDKEKRNADLMRLISIISLIITIIGLVSIVSFTNKQKIKELSIRKVFGATPISLLKFILKNYLIVFVSSIIIAIPSIWYIINLWLNNYAYRINPDLLDGVLLGIFFILICITTISFQSLKSINVNPAQTLKNE